MSETEEQRRARLVELFEERIPFNKHLGFRVAHLSAKRAVLSMETRAEHIGDARRPALHGGLISAMADTAGGLVCFNGLSNPRDRVSTIDMRVDYLRPATPGQPLHCEASLVRMGNRVGVARILVFSGSLPAIDLPDRQDVAIATAHAAYNVLRR